MRLSIEASLQYRLHSSADLLLAIEVAQLPDQRLVADRLTSSGTDALLPIAGQDGIGRRIWTRGAGLVAITYAATLDVERAVPDLARLAADPLPRLPPEVVGYLWPSRYCDNIRFEPWVRRRFGALDGGAKVAAMAEWVRTRIAYVPGASAGITTAADSFVRREGVCRDFAHLLIAMVRAADIPARMVGGYGLGVRPPDFHAVVEVWLAGDWRLVDPTGFAAVDGIVRVGVGRDATDVGFLTIFGTADYVDQRVAVTRIDADFP